MTTESRGVVYNGDVGRARIAVESHVRFWNDRDRDSWVKLFSPSVIFEDPEIGRAHV